MKIALLVSNCGFCQHMTFTSGDVTDALQEALGKYLAIARSASKI